MKHSTPIKLGGIQAANCSWGYKRNEDKTKSDQGEGSARTRGTLKIHGYNKKFERTCYNCGKKGHMAKVC